MNFKTWAEQKKIKNRDLVFINSIKSPAQAELFNQISDKMANLNPTFSEGLVFLEQITDLILMDNTKNLLADSEDFKSWSSSVQNLRYPQTKLRDAETKSFFEKLSWPAGAKTNFERRGDRSGVELKLFISSKSDLEKYIAALERVLGEMKK